MIRSARPKTYVSSASSAFASFAADLAAAVFPVAFALTGRQGALDQAERPHGLAMPEAPADVFDRIGEARTVPAGADRGVRPAAGTLSGVLDAHRQVEPVKYMKDSSGARGLSQRSRAVGAVAQNRHLRVRGHAETAQHAVQLRALPVGLTGHAAEQDQPSIVIADLGRHHLKRPTLVAARRPDMPGIDRHRHRLRRRRRWRRFRPPQALTLEASPNPRGPAADRLVPRWVIADGEELRQEPPGAAIWQPSPHLR